MTRHALTALLVGLLAPLLGVLASPASAAGDDYRGVARLGDCSASVVRYPTSEPADAALVLTAGHCVTYPFLKAREVLVDQATTKEVTLLDRRGKDLVTLPAARLVYATMWTTDAALYRLTLTYQQLVDTYGVSPFTLADRRAGGHEQISIPAGFEPRTYRCTLQGFAFRLHERIWDWDRSLRYPSNDGCGIIGGTSGAPVLDETRTVIGVNNTGYVGGKACRDTVCESDRAGRVRLRPHAAYGQQTWVFTTCLDPGTRALDLAVAGCRLPSPR